MTVATTDLDGIRNVRQAGLDAGMVPLVGAPADATIDGDGAPNAVQRPFATACSIKSDPFLVAGVPGPGADT
ncbi:MULTISPECIES: hypothetical protein [Streptomyces]|uniref:hypothetical protein n=1 Tax=Streptomyces TaxID=1883 RepID=UPI00017E8598|nr:MULTISPECIES: hypothetical protein [unclassified Streptomyces]AKL64213.1 hypothetical protein M444_00685 [Streptomyces sp. Mg1]EDX21177.1 hypothetical protein SSAG_00968 [Streptomyces sp. Mg1]WSX95774.1 hypothetical protein OG590_00135 [Streptomyces goshikiensis]